jgi:endonuclease-3
MFYNFKNYKNKFIPEEVYTFFYRLQMRKKIININELLIRKYGIPKRSAILPDPVDLLIATILSQNTNDKNSYKAYNNLKYSFKSWEEIANLPRVSIEKYIRVAGLGKQKSNAIKKFLTSILKTNGRINLDNLKKLDNEEILSELTHYGGIGTKTASCVLLFSLRRNVCPVDTHVHRTTNRIGLVKTKSPDKTFALLNSEMPENIAHSFHTNLIRLGREICKPANPNCTICPLLKICEYDDKNLNNNSAYKENNFLLLDSIK